MPKFVGAIDVNGAYTLPTADGSANQVLTTDGSGSVTFATATAVAGSNTHIQYNDGGSLGGSANFTFDGTSTVTLASTDAGSSAAPIIELYRNSSSPADADYLGQIKFQGEDDGGGKVVYAKITAKIDDASNTTEDGIIEIAHMKAGSNNISARFTSTALKLINGTGLEVADGSLTLGSTAVTATAAELNLLDGITAGTVSASLAVVADSNKDVTGFRNVTATGIVDAVNFKVNGGQGSDGQVLTSTGSGVAWEDAAGGGASVTISDSAPGSPSAGNLWFESDTGKTFIYYADGSSNQWVEVGGATTLLMGGSDHHIQFNDNGSLGGSANFTFDGSTAALAGTLNISGDNDITDFTADNHGMLSLYNSDGAVDDFTCLDFIGNGTQAAARIGMKYTSSGSRLLFGTTNNYAAGVNAVGLHIRETGLVGTGEGDGLGSDFVMYSGTSGSYVHFDEDFDSTGYYSLTGALRFHGNTKIYTGNTTQSASNYQIIFSQDYAIYTDNTGPGSDNSRMWINGVDGAALYLGPRSGSHTWNLIRLSASTIQLLGTVSKTAGSFDIPHPTKGDDWRLRHSFIEGPTADNIYRGTVTISGDSATIDLDTVSGMTDGTWEALNTNPWAMVASSGNAVTWELSGKTLTIDGPDGAVCSWMLIGERKDQGIVDSPMTDDDGKLIVEYEDAERDACPED